MMNKSFLLLSILLLALLLPQQGVDGFWGGRRRRRIRVRRVVCVAKCGWSCTNVNCGLYGVCPAACTYVCSRSCNRKKKREIDDNEMSDEQRMADVFPSSLSAYDKDKDGKISNDEFAHVAALGSRPDHETKKAFTLSDRNGDSYIDCKELKVAPLLFKEKPTC